MTPKFRKTIGGFAHSLEQKFKSGNFGNNFGKNQVAEIIMKEAVEFLDTAPELDEPDWDEFKREFIDDDLPF